MATEVAVRKSSEPARGIRDSADGSEGQLSGKSIVRQPFTSLKLQVEKLRKAARLLVRRGGMEALRTPKTDPVAARLGQFPGRLEGGLPREWRVGLEADVDSRKRSWMRRNNEFCVTCFNGVLAVPQSL